MLLEQPKPPLPKEDLEHVFKLSRELWEEARNSQFLITGGTGFFGMWLLESFNYINDALKLGMNAVVVTRDVDAFRRKAPHLVGRQDLHFLEGDIRTFAYPKGEFRYVIHAAAEASAKLNAENPREMFDSITSGTAHLLGFAAQAGTSKLLLTSSGAIYGKQPSDMTHIPETYSGAPDPLHPGSAYGMGKRTAEHLCILEGAASGYEVKIARCFAFVGPHLPLDTHFAIGNFLNDVLSGRSPKINGDGSPYRSYLYASDLAVALWTILFKGKAADAYNVGSRFDLTIADLANLVEASVGQLSPPRALEASPKVGGVVTRYVPAVCRAERELGLREHIMLPEAILKTAAWHRNQSEC